MKLQSRVWLYFIEFHPWPFGPPLRGRAPLDEVQPYVAKNPQRLALITELMSVLIEKLNRKVSNGNQDWTRNSSFDIRHFALLFRSA